MNRLTLACTLPTLLTASLVVLGGCNDSVKSTSGTSMSATSTPSAGDDVDRIAEYTALLDDRYVIGPSAADRMGYRADWNISTSPAGGGGIKSAVLQGDSLFTLDSRNNLTRVATEGGQQLWRSSVVHPVDAAHGISRVTNSLFDVVMVTTDSNVWVLSTGNGELRTRYDLAKISSTPPVIFGPYLIYGSINGDLVWLQHELGAVWRGYSLGGAIRTQPVLSGNMVAVVTDTGNVWALSAADALQFWKKRTLAGIVAPPAVGPAAVYVASLDQHLYAYGAATGQTRWKHLTSAELRDPPVLLGNHLYQQVPGEGLLCFDPMPIDKYEGVVLWTAPDVTGTVIGEHRGRLFVWDADRRELCLVDEASGGLVDRLDLSKVDILTTSGMRSGDLYAVGDDGQVSRLVPRN